MAKSNRNSKVDFFFDGAEKWQQEFRLLRRIVLSSGLSEEIKWGCPCYTFQNKNIVLMHGFKNYCALLFFKGALMKDESNILIRQTENVQSGRQVRFTDVEEIIKAERTLKSYITEAKEVEKSGLKVALKKPEEYKMPEELVQKLKENPALKTAFNALTPGRQRAYKFYFSAPKQSKTREARIEKCIVRILNGQGLND